MCLSRLLVCDACLHVLSHLLSSDHLAEAVIELLLVENLWLGSTHKDLANDSRVIEGVLNALACQYLSLSTLSLGFTGCLLLELSEKRQLVFF